MSVDFRRIVETCFAQEALEVWLIAGRPPLLRFKDNLRELKVVDALSAREIVRLVFSATAPNLEAWYRKHGFCAFDYPCEWRNNARIRIFAIKHGKSTTVTVTPLPDDAPGLQYRDGPSGQRSLRGLGPRFT